MSYIRQKYEQLFPQTNRNDEQIIAHMFDACPPQNVLPEIPDRTFEMDEELHDFLQPPCVIPIDSVISQLASNL